MEKKVRNYSMPFMVQMVSGEPNEHCDLFPYRSLHDVQKCDEGHLWKMGARSYSIPDHFKTIEVPLRSFKQLPLKQCVECNNLFPAKWVFATENQCIRCFERLNVSIKGMTRDEYRELLRKELKGVR